MQGFLFWDVSVIGSDHPNYRLASLSILWTGEEQMLIGFILARIAPAEWGSCWSQVVQPLLAGQQAVHQLEEEWFACWAEAMETTDPVAFTPEDIWMMQLHLARDQLLSVFQIYLSLNNISFKKKSLPFFDWHMQGIQRGLFLHFSDKLEKLLIVIGGESWVG